MNQIKTTTKVIKVIFNFKGRCNFGSWRTITAIASVELFKIYQWRNLGFKLGNIDLTVNVHQKPWKLGKLTHMSHDM